MDVPSSVSVGALFQGKYRVERVIGAGGWGTVFAARHVELDELVAIKVLRSTRTSDGGVPTERFLREARLSAKIKSTHVARVIDVARLEDGSAYMVMEYLEGRDLGRVLARDGALPVSVAVSYVLEACEALAEAHALGIVHRDIKPANLFCVERRDGTRSIKLLDFGVARATEPGERSLTGSLTMVGSPRYMAPEQITSSRDVDARADVWALGVTLFELVTGKPPFVGETLAQLCTSIQREPPRSARGLRAELPAELEAVLDRCLEKDREARLGSVAELAAALAPFASSAGTDETMDAPTIADRTLTATTIVAKPSSSRAVKAALAFAPIAILGAIVLFASSARERAAGDDPRETPSPGSSAAPSEGPAPHVASASPRASVEVPPAPGSPEPKTVRPPPRMPSARPSTGAARGALPDDRE